MANTLWLAAIEPTDLHGFRKNCKCFFNALYGYYVAARHLIEYFFGKIKHYPRIFSLF